MNEEMAKVFVTDVYLGMMHLDRYDVEEVFGIDGDTVMRWLLFEVSAYHNV